MKRMTAITLTAMMVLIASAMTAGADTSADIRGAVAGVSVNGANNLVAANTADGTAAQTFTWTAANYAGFFYDLKKDISTENLTVYITGTNTLSGDSGKRGVVYQTAPKSTTFKYNPTGSPLGTYNVIGFLADKYFGSYTPGSYLASKATDYDALSNSKLFKILYDDNTERTFTSGTPLQLMDGYQLNIKSIDVDGNKAYVELDKNGQVMDSAIVQPSKTNASFDDQMYVYKPDVSVMKKFPEIAIHFKNAFRGSDTNLATIDGIWQLKDTPADVSTNQAFDKMTITGSSAKGIKMENKDNDVTLSKNQNISIMPGVNFQTADNNTLRFYVHKVITTPGSQQIRGAVAGVSVNGANNLVATNTADGTAAQSFTWNAGNFAGFFYDLKKDISTENITVYITGGNTLSGDSGKRGVVYETAPKSTTFKYNPTGSPLGTYNVIGFLADKYFASYTPGSYLAVASTDYDALSNSRLFKILYDDNTERTFTSGTPLQLMDGYQLNIKSIDIKGNKAYVELTKNGQVMDSAVVQPSVDNPTLDDQMYVYKPDVSPMKKFAMIAIHFKNAFIGGDTNLATIDGIWQLQDTPRDVSTNQVYDKMTITGSSAKDIKMENKDNDVTLSKNQNISIMPGVNIQTADNNTLRFYVFKPVFIAAAAAAPTVTPTPANVTAPTNVTKPANVTAPTNVTKPANVTAPTNVTKPANATTTTPPKAPGFEGIFALTGLMAVAYLILGRKQ